jgi:peroxiredoxin
MKNKWFAFFLSLLLCCSSLLAFSPTSHSFSCDLTFYKNKYIFKIEGHPVEMPVKVFFDEVFQSYMIPLRFLANSLRYNVEWNSLESIAFFSSTSSNFSIKINGQESLVVLSPSSKNTGHFILQHDRIYADQQTVAQLFEINMKDTYEPNTTVFTTLRDRIYIPAPNFTLLDTQGQTFDLYQELNKPENEYIVLNFYATRCPFCLKALPLFVELSDDYSDKNVSVVGVNTDTAGQEEDRDKKLEKYNVRYTVVQDINNHVYDRYHVAGVPNFYVINQDHEIVFHSLVADEDQIRLLRQWLDLNLN